MTMDLKDILKDAFKYIGKKEIHVNELAAYVREFVSEYKNEDIEKLKTKINAKLAGDLKRTLNGKIVENKESIFIKVSNGKKGFKKGVYALRPERKVKRPIEPDKKIKIGDLFGSDTTKNKPSELSSHLVSSNLFENLSTGQIGKGGEFAVVSELLFRGFNANIMTVDDGVDICATKEKDGKFFLIQVKTTSCNDDTFLVNIDKNSYSRYNVSNMYYIVVVRFIKEGLPQNQYLIFNSFDIERLVTIGFAGDSQKYYSMKFKVWNGDIRIVRQGKDDSIIFHLNNWGWIK